LCIMKVWCNLYTAFLYAFVRVMATALYGEMELRNRL
jgi:hypothetical protein